MAPTAPSSRSRWLEPVLLVLAVVLAYANTLRAPFLFDDEGAVLRNPTIRRLASWDILRPPADGSTTTARPLVNATFALNYAISGEDPWSYHAANLAIHAAAALVLLGLLRRTPGFPAAGAFWAALLWALHPLNTESVTCIAQRTESLCGLLYLLTLWCFARAPAHRGWSVGAVLACLLGMATKEVAVTAPLVVLLYDRTFFSGSFAAAFKRHRGLYAALAGTWIVLAVLVLQAGAARGASAGFARGVSSWDYLLTQCRALVTYARLAVWPHTLVLDYGTAVVRFLATVWLHALAVLLALGIACWLGWRRRAAGFALLAAFILLAPSSSVVPLVTQTIAEHRMYLPLAGLIALAIGALSPAARLPRFALTAAALAFGVLTHARNHAYRDPLAIWTDNVAKNPDGARGRNNLALALQSHGRNREAEAQFARAVALDPNYVTARYDWAVLLLAGDRAVEAVAQLEAVVRLAPDHADAQLNLGNALVRAGRPADAVAHYAEALRLHPAADAHFNLGIALLDLHRPDEALAHFQSALALDPALAEAHARLGELFRQRGELAAASEHLRATLRLRPADATAYARLGNLGNTLLLQNRPREALICYEEMLRVRPDDARTRENLKLAQEAAR